MNMQRVRPLLGRLEFLFLGAFAKLRNANISFVMSVFLSFRLKQLGSQCTDFYEILCLGIFQESAQKILVSLKSEKNNGYIT